MSNIGLLVNMVNAQPHVQHVNRNPFPGQKVLQHEADYSPPTRAEVKFCGAIPPLPICLQDKHKNNSSSIKTTVKTLHSFKHKDNVKNKKQKSWFRPIMLAVTQHLALRKVITKLRTPHLLFCITYWKLGNGMSAVCNLS